MAKQETEEQKYETKECLQTVRRRFNEYFQKQGINAWDDKFIKKVAYAIGVRPSTVAACFRGERLTTANLIKLADYLHVSTDYLLGLAEDTSGFETYSDIFFYLKYLIDNGYLAPSYYKIMKDMPGPDHITQKMMDGEEPIPETHPEEVNVPTFALFGKFATYIWQYQKLDAVLQHDEEYLQSYIDITLSRLDNAPNHKNVDFQSRFKEVQDTRKITNVELKEQLNLNATYMISKYRSGSYPVPKIVQKIADQMHVSADHLLGLSCNYDRSVSERDVFKVLILLCKHPFLYPYKDDMGHEYTILCDPILYQFCSLYHARFKICTDSERMDFFNEIRKRFSYPLIDNADMPTFNAIQISEQSTDTHYMQDYAERLKKYYSLYSIKKRPSEQNKKQGTK